MQTHEEIINNKCKWVLNSIIEYHLKHLPNGKGDFANAEISIGREEDWIEDESLHEALNVLKEKGYIKKFTKTKIVENKIPKPDFTNAQVYHYPDEAWEAMQEYEDMTRTMYKELLVVTIPYAKSKIDDLIAKAKAKKSKKQITIVIYSPSQGLYRMIDDVRLSYPVKKQRAKIVTSIASQGFIEGQKTANELYYGILTNLNKSIKEVNKHFKNELKLDHDLIVRRPTGGYEFNSCYRVKVATD